LKERGDEISFKIRHANVPLANGSLGNINTTYQLESGSPLTWVSVKSDVPKATLASGLVKSAKVKRIRNSNSVKKGEWRYIATWVIAWVDGQQEKLNK